MSWHGRTNAVIADYFARGMRVAPGEVILPSGKRARLYKHPNGYDMVSLGESRKRRNHTVARLICWQEYGPPPFDGAMCDHIDGDATNDHPSNLRWATPKVNSNNVSEAVRRKRVELGKRVGPTRTLEQRRETNSPLTPKDVARIKRLQGAKDRRGKKISQERIGAAFGVHQRTVSRIWRGETWA